MAPLFPYTCKPAPLLRALTAAILALSLTATASARTFAVTKSSDAATGLDTIVIDPATTTRTIPTDFFGINYVGFWDSAQGSAASAAALTQTPIKAVRFAGGDPADWYDWADPYYKGWSATSPLDLWRYAQKFGAMPVFQTNFQGNLPNPPGQSYAVNSPQNAAAWVAYDKAQGITATMEVGNEEDMALAGANTAQDDARFQPYIDAFKAQATAMHRADPNVKVIGPACTNEWFYWNRDFLGMFLRQTGHHDPNAPLDPSSPDGLSLHYYAGSTWSDSMGVAQTWASRMWQYTQDVIRQNDTRQLPVYLSEWNVGGSDSGNSFNASLGKGLVMADMLGAFAQSGVAQEDYFDVHTATHHGLLYGTGESRPVDSPTPAYYATAMWGHMGRSLLPLTQSSWVNAGTEVSAYAAKKDDGSLQVLAINKQGAAQNIAVQLDGASAAGHHLHVDTLSGVNGGVFDLDATYNGVVNPSPQQPLPGPQDAGIVSGDTVSYTLPAYSAVILDLDGMTPAPRFTPTPTGASATPTAMPPTATSANTGVPPMVTNTAVPPTAVPPTATGTNTAVPLTATNTATKPPTATDTNTPVPPTATATSTLVPYTATRTVVPPTATGTNTAVPPTPTTTSTRTTVPPTATRTVVPPAATGTNTPVPPTATETDTAVPPTATNTATESPTATWTAAPMMATRAPLPPTTAPGTTTRPSAVAATTPPTKTSPVTAAATPTLGRGSGVANTPTPTPKPTSTRDSLRLAIGTLPARLTDGRTFGIHVHTARRAAVALTVSGMTGHALHHHGIANAAGDYTLYIRATNTSTKPVRSQVVVTARRDNTTAGARAPFVVYPRGQSAIHAARAASAMRGHSRAHARQPSIKGPRIAHLMRHLFPFPVILAFGVLDLS